MNMTETKLEGVKIIEPNVFHDKRGFFTESYNKEKFKELGLNYDFIQDNHSLSTEKGIIRGLHYQMDPKAQTKLVRVITGGIYDVAVDIRKGSETYGQWVGVELTGDNQRMLLVPEGFAHGFCTLSEHTHVQYKVDNYYSPQHDKGILWNDPELAIDWPAKNPVLSEKDSRQPLFREAANHFEHKGIKEASYDIL